MPSQVDATPNLTLMMEGASSARIEGAAAIAQCLCRSSGREGRAPQRPRGERLIAGLLQTERKAQKVNSRRPASSPFRRAGRRFFSWQLKIESAVAVQTLWTGAQREENVQIPARAAATPVRDRSVPKPLRERAKEHARRSSGS